MVFCCFFFKPQRFYLKHLSKIMVIVIAGHRVIGLEVKKQKKSQSAEFFFKCRGGTRMKDTGFMLKSKHFPLH